MPQPAAHSVALRRLPGALRVLPASILLIWAGAASAQSQAAAAPAPAASSAGAAPPVQEVEVRGRRPAESEQRRQSTASKVIIGREEIERHGDTSLGELLKRLPGVTLQDGRIRMRGLGGGYTQILLDGERTQAGISLESLDPEQIERIEIIRAPTAETGARAIAGTINIITREGAARRLNDLKLSLGREAGEWQPRAVWSRENRLEGGLDYSITLTASHGPSAGRSQVRTVNTDPAELLDATEHRRTASEFSALHARARLQWRGADGESFTLSPLWGHIPSENHLRTFYEQPVAQGQAPYDTAQADTRTHVDYGRLNGMWRHRLGEGRMEWRGSLGGSRVSSRTERIEQGAGGSTLYGDESETRGRSASVSLKHSLLVADAHSLVSGLELESERRDEQRTSRVDGVVSDDNFGATYEARVRRVAAYVQDEWSVNRQWSAHAGLRWEGIGTRGESADGATDNRSSVWSPLLHLMWRPEPRSRDQVRVSLTRSYRSPELSQLVGARWAAKGDNSPTNPDRAGNPDLRPELATGLDVALERYLPGGGMFSASVFHRRIQDLVRTVVSSQAQAGGGVRYVSQPRNLGRATSQGIELEAKFRLNELWAEAAATELRAGLSLYRSRVDGVAGPDNRLDQQADGSLTLGLDHKLTAWPVTLGGSLGYTPGYTTRIAQDQWVVRDDRRSLDLYAQWQVRPDLRWRLSVNNALARETQGSSTVGTETATTLSDGRTQWRLQLEMKL